MKYAKRTIVIALVFANMNIAFAASCKNYSSCEEAVIQWCKGNHPRADGDGDGIPCENVCTSLEKVEEIKKKINCKK